MRYKYYFCEQCNPKLMALLETNNIHYVLSGQNTCRQLVSFYIWNTSHNAEVLMKQFEKICTRAPIVSVEYSASELANARLLMMTPRRQNIDIVNESEAYVYSCERVDAFGITRVGHREQCQLFVIAKEPSMKTKTAFWTESTGFSEIFTKQSVYELVNENNLSGIEFKNVMMRNGNYSANEFQLTSKNKIDAQCIAMGYGERKLHCPICGKQQFFIDNVYQLHLDFNRIKDQSDLYVTECIFGEGIPYPLYLISQLFYQLLRENKLISAVTFSPVVEIN